MDSGTLLTRVSQVGFSCDALQAFIDSARYSEAVLLAPAAISGDQFRAHWRSPPAPSQLQVTRDPLELPELKTQVDELMAGIALLSQPEDQVRCRVSLLAVAAWRRWLYEPDNEMRMCVIHWKPFDGQLSWDEDARELTVHGSAEVSVSVAMPSVAS